MQRLRRLFGRRSARYDEGLFVVEGDVLVKEAIAAKFNVREIFVRQDRVDDAANLRSVDAPVYILEESVFNSLSDTVTPQGISAICEIPTPKTLSCDPNTWVIVADAVGDPGNLGTIMRSCEVAGASALVLVNNTVDPFSPKVVRASAGAVFHLPVFQDLSYMQLKEMGMRLVGTTSHKDLEVSPISYEQLDCSGCVGVVFGNEAHGISLDAPMDEWVTIEHVGRSESLNVAMSAAILAMHVSQERKG